MFFDNFSAFMEMGGHGFYVWLSFGLTALLIIGNVAYVRVARRNFFREHALQQIRLTRKGEASASSNQQSQKEKALER